MKTPDKSTQDFLKLLHTLKRAKKTDRRQYLIQNIVDKNLPQWFIPMINDTPRNNFYFKMIENNVAGKTVLEIGAGIGMMSIHAAKSGAKHVYACELNPLLYYIAKENIEKSGYAKKITIFLGHSDDLELGKHLPKKVDIILSELISTDIFSEYMLPSLEKAEQFLKKDGIFLPAKMNIKGCLVSFKDDLKAFLSPTSPLFEDLADFSKKRAIMVDLFGLDYEIVSPAIDLFSIQKGYEVTPEFPITFELERNKKKKNTYFCLFFELQDGKNKLVNLDFKVKRHSHWATLLWKLEDHNRPYKMQLRNVRDRLYLFENDK